MNVARIVISLSLVASLPVSGADRNQRAATQPDSPSRRGADVVAEPRQQLRAPIYHALIIANKNYRRFPSLKTPFEDAREVEQVLRTKYGFQAGNVTVLRDATRADIYGRLSELRAKLTADDSLLIYYAGHGIIDPKTKRGYWLPVDADHDVETNWVSNEDITNYLQGMSARHILIVSDSCYSGTLTRAVSFDAQMGGELEWINRKIQNRARTALTSGGLEPVEDEGGQGHSVFAKAFLQVLRENDRPRDMNALFQQISTRVVWNARQTPEYAAIRLANHEGGDFVFIPVGARIDLPPSVPPTRRVAVDKPEEPIATPPPESPKGIVIKGTWKNPANPMLSYVFDQQGTTVMVQEINQEQGARSITAQGTGQINGRMVTLSLKTAFGTGGMSVLTLSDDGQSMTGTYTDNSSHESRLIMLSR